MSNSLIKGNYTNCLVCGRPGSGKSSIITRLLIYLDPHDNSILSNKEYLYLD